MMKTRRFNNRESSGIPLMGDSAAKMRRNNVCYLRNSII